MPYGDPGFAASQTLDALLLQKAALRRQAMLDELDRRKTESQIANQDENTATNKMLREAQAQQMADAAKVKLAGTFGMHQELDPETAKKLDPSWVDFPKQRPNTPFPDSTVFGPLSDEYGSAATQAPIPGALQPPDENDKITFKGLPAQQEDEARQKAVEDFLNGPDGDQLDPTVKSIMRIQMLGGDKNLNVPAGAFTKPQEIWTYDEATGLFTGPQGQTAKGAPAGARIVQRSRPPVGQGAPGPVYIVGPDAKANPVIDATTGKPINAPRGGKIMPEPASAQDKLIPPNEAIAMSKAYEDLKKSMGKWWNKDGSDAMRSKYNILVQNAIGYAKNHPKAQAAIQAAFSDPEATDVPAADLLLSKRFSLTDPLDQQVFVSILSQVRGY